MISYKGYDDIIERVYAYRQDHVFAGWDKLIDDQKESLLHDLKDIDFDQLQKIYSETGTSAHKGFVPAPYIPLPRNDKEKEAFRQAEALGRDYIAQGKMAAFIVAGGQGSRLGYDGPKGMFPTAPVSGKTLFQIHAEKIVKYAEKYGVVIPWYIMTSQANHDDTCTYFADNDFFGMNATDVFIFPQNMVPSLDTNGKLILETECSIFKNPDGHGGSLTALKTSGALDLMKDRGIDTISYFQVDNPLVKIIDPLFIGFHVRKDADISSKALKKANAEEKVGVFVKYEDNSFGIMEYSDLSDEQIHAVDEQGELLYSSGNPAIHLFQREFIESITSGSNLSLPYHRATKKIQAYDSGRVKEIEGYKYEKFVFDALSLTEKNLVLETIREEDFAPVKNATGVDSIETSHALMSALHRKWLKERGVAVPPGVKVIEISPRVAVEPDDIPADTVVPDKEKVLLEKEGK